MKKERKTLSTLRSDKEIAEFWATHDFTDYEHEFTEVQTLEEPDNTVK